MKGKSVALTIAGLLLVGLLRAQDTYAPSEFISPVSEETEPAFCPSGWAATGIRCTGSYCDNITLSCTRYTQTPATTHRAPHRWSSKWISEEALSDSESGWSIAQGDPNSFITGIRCSGSYCDNVQVDLDASDLPVGGACAEPEWVSEESGAEWEGTNGWRSCPQGQFLRALRCRGDYCDDMQLMCCNPADHPAPPQQVVSQYVGAGGYTCPTGFAMAGARCAGSYCGAIELHCRRYAPGPDADGTYAWTPSFSEEGRESGADKFESDSALVAGLRCSGENCDNVALNLLSTPRLRNTGECRWTPAFSEESDTFREVRNWTDCGDGEFVGGVQCSGDYCDNVALRCCKVATRDWKRTIYQPPTP